MLRRDLFSMAAAPLAFAACTKKRGPLEKIRVTAGPYFSMGSLYVALESGYFEREGLSVETRQISASNQAIPLIAGGQIDVGFMSASASLMNAVLKGALIRIVAGREIASPTCGDAMSLYVFRKSFPDGFSDLKKLKGKRVATHTKGAVSDFAMDLILGQAGLSRNDIEEVSLTQSESVAALLSGKVDAVIGSFHPVLTAATHARLIARATGASAIYPNFQYSHILFGSRLLQGDPGRGKAFLRAYLQGAREFLQGKTPKYLAEYAQSMNVELSQIQGACRDSFTPDGRIQTEDLQRLVDWAIKKEYTSGVTVEQLVDRRFLPS
ncbi:MAG: ABC transporter substrate-binding protein [Bryobacteraceae bacterium]